MNFKLIFTKFISCLLIFTLASSFAVFAEETTEETTETSTVVDIVGPCDFTGYTGGNKTPACLDTGGTTKPSQTRTTSDGGYDSIVALNGAYGKTSDDVSFAIKKYFPGSLDEDAQGNAYTKAYNADGWTGTNMVYNLLTDKDSDSSYADETYDKDVIHFSYQFAYEGSTNTNRYVCARFKYGSAKNLGAYILALKNDVLSVLGRNVELDLKPQTWYDIDVLFYLTDSTGAHATGVEFYVNGYKQELTLNSNDSLGDDGIYYLKLNNGSNPLYQLYFTRFGASTGTLIHPANHYELTAFDNVSIRAMTRADVPEFKEIPPLKMPSFFANGAVLPRDTALTLYGMVRPGASISVELDSKTYTTIADADGNWEVTADAISVENNPYTMTVTSSTNETLTFVDILAGDVWLCSGQSNMDMSLNQFVKQNDSEQAKEDIANAPTDSNIRFFTHDLQGSDTEKWDVTNGEWKICSTSTVGEFSATGYHFVRNLQPAVGVPVGIIESARSSSKIECWITKPAMLAGGLEDRVNYQHETSWEMGSGKLFNAMIAPFTKLKIKGVIWYQGEGNNTAHTRYLNMQKVMLADWRAHWGYEVPFILAQIAPDATEIHSKYYEYIREAQYEFANQVSGVDMVSLMDVGEKNNVHPNDKRTVGARLALAAQKTAYGMNVQSKYPSPSDFAYNGDELVITFKDVYDGLKTPDGTTSLKGFKVCNADGEFYDAEAEITSANTVTVTCDGISDIRGVEYAFTPYPEPVVNLYNSANLVTTSFRHGLKDDSLITFDNYTTKNGTPSPETAYGNYSITSVSTTNVYEASAEDGSYRTIYPQKGLWGKDIHNTSAVMEGKMIEENGYHYEPYFRFIVDNAKLSAENGVHIRLQMAFDGTGTEDKSRFVGVRFGGPSASDSTTNAYLNPKLITISKDGVLKSNGKSTGITLEKQKWYSFDLVIKQSGVFAPDAYYMLYVNGRRVKISGESSEGWTSYSNGTINGATTIAEIRIGWVDKIEDSVYTTAIDNLSIVSKNLSKISVDKSVSTEFNENGSSLDATIDIMKQTDIQSADVIVASYNSDGELIRVNYNNTVALENGAAKLNLTNMDTSGADITKVFVVDSSNNLTPLHEAYEK